MFHLSLNRQQQLLHGFSCVLTEPHCLQADALIVDLYMGTGNEAAGFRWTIGGWWGAVGDGQNDIGGVVFNFTLLDQLARGLHGAKVQFRPCNAAS